MSTTVYRCFDQSGALLYVGISDRFPRRMQEHASGKHWWSNVSTITLQQYDSHDEARSAEQEGIDMGQPLYNQVRALGKTPLSSFRIPDEVKAAAVERAAAEGKTLTDVVVEHLRRYGKGGKR